MDNIETFEQWEKRDGYRYDYPDQARESSWEASRERSIAICKNKIAMIKENNTYRGKINQQALQAIHFIVDIILNIQMDSLTQINIPQ